MPSPAHKLTGEDHEHDCRRWRAAEYGVPSPGIPRGRGGGDQPITGNNQKIEGFQYIIQTTVRAMQIMQIKLN